MRDQPRPEPLRPPSRGRFAAALLGASLLVAACGGASAPSGGASATPAEPTPTPVTSAEPSATPTPSDAPPGATPPTTTETAWGVIWDAIPGDYPVPESATPAELNEPVSAAWARGGRRVAIAEAMRVALLAAGWSIEGVTESEGGSVAIDAVKGPPECRTQVRVEPRGDQVFIIVRYAAACPWS